MSTRKNKRMNFILIAVSVAILFTVSGCNPHVDKLNDLHGESSSYYISKNRKHIYYWDWSAFQGVHYDKVYGANAEKFIALGNSFGKDDKQVFKDGCPLKGYYPADGSWVKEVDLESFVVDKKGFPKDKYRVYKGSYASSTLYEINGADPNTFDGMDGGVLTRDGKHYFYFEHRLDIADYDSFVFIECSGFPKYGKDKIHAYVIKTDNYYSKLPAGATVIKGADPQTFEVIEKDNEWAKDNKHYYYWGEQSDIDYESFQILYSELVIDKDHVYRNGQIIDKTVEEAKAESEARFKRDNPDSGK